MNNISKLGLAALLLSVVALVVAVTSGKAPAQSPAVNVTVDVGDAVRELTRTVSSKLGATPGSEWSTDVLTVNGIGEGYSSTLIGAATTSLCAIRNPHSATSSIDWFSARISTGLTGANTFDVSTSTSPSGSSTPALVYGRSVASAAQDSLIWTPTNIATSTLTAGQVLTLGPTPNGGSTFILAANEYVTYRVASSSPGGTYRGACQAKFTKL